MPSPRVFVSSVMDGYRDVRSLAKYAIASAGGLPILAEDFPAVPVSPRTACLDAVASCDVLLLIIGARGGFVAPSGKLVVREEYDEARHLGRPVLVFIEDTDRDPEATALVDELSGYASGLFRATFCDSEELRTKICAALMPVLEHHMRERRSPEAIESALVKSEPFLDHTTLRVVSAPERDDYLFDVIEAEGLPDRLYSIGHTPDVRLFSYSLAKTHQVLPASVEILQDRSDASSRALDVVRVAVEAKGLVTIDINVTGRDGFHSYMAILKGELLEGARRAVRFTSNFLAARDPYLRFDPLMMNMSLSGVGHRRLLESIPANGSYTVGDTGARIISAFEQPRIVPRARLDDAVGLAREFCEMFTRLLST